MSTLQAGNHAVLAAFYLSLHYPPLAETIAYGPPRGFSHRGYRAGTKYALELGNDRYQPDCHQIFVPEGMAMNRFVIAEPRLCIGCNTCMAACSRVHKAEGLQEHPRLTVMRNATVTAPILCRHCEDAWCARVCPVNAITMTNHSVELDETTCIGCKLCAIACPFGAITPAGSKPLAVPDTFPEFIPMSELSDVPFSPANMHPLLARSAGVRTVAVKCDLCRFQPQGPECVRVCPTNALILVDEQSIEQANRAKRMAAACGLADNGAFLAMDSAPAISHEEQKR